MRRGQEFATDGVGDLERQFAEASENTPRHGNTDKGPSPASYVDLDKPKTSKFFKKAIAVTAIGGLVMGGIGAANYWLDYNSAIFLHTATDGRVLAPGSATVEEVNLDISDIPVATYFTKVGDLPVGVTKRLVALSGIVNFPIEQTTLKRTATVDATVSVRPKKVSIHFDAMKDAMTVTVPSGTGLSSELTMPADKKSTTDGSAWKILPQQDSMVDAANEIAGALKLFGVDVDASQMWGVGGAAAAVTKTHSDLENFADITILNGVGQQCMPLITKIPGFNDGIKINIRSAVQGELLDANFTNDPAHKDLAILMDRPVRELQQIVSESKVVLAPDYKIAPDKSNTDALKKWTKSGIFKSDLKAIDCKVDKNVKIIMPKNMIKKPAATAVSTPSPIKKVTK